MSNIILTSYKGVFQTADAALAESHLSDRQRASRRVDEPWTLAKGFDHAIDMLTNGWQEGFDYMMEVGEIPAQEILVPEVYSDRSGISLDIGAYVRGEPEQWLDEEVPDKKMVSITVNCSFSASVSAKAILQRCLVVHAVASTLEALGYVVSVKGYCSVSSDMHVITEFIVKDPSEPLDLYNMGYMLGHPSLLRHIAFSIWECMGKKTVDAMGFTIGRGYGYPCDIPDEMKGDIHFDKVLSKTAVSKETLIKKAREYLAGIGIKWTE